VPTAAVLSTATPTPVAVMMPSTVLKDGSDSEYVLAPFYTPHFFLDCAVGGSTASFVISIWAFIDHGSNAVLIEPSLADCLGLKQRKLLILKHVEMAVGTGKSKECFMFDE
jgi:hypothetical protein